MKSMLDLNCMNSMKVKKKIMSCRELQAVLVFLLACCQRWLFSTLLPHELQSESRQTRVNAHLTRAQESRGGGELSSHAFSTSSLSSAGMGGTGAVAQEAATALLRNAAEREGARSGRSAEEGGDQQGGETRGCQPVRKSKRKTSLSLFLSLSFF